jgi:hypothetical protein
MEFLQAIEGGFDRQSAPSPTQSVPSPDDCVCGHAEFAGNVASKDAGIKEPA